jgi:hypothetical protein
MHRHVLLTAGWLVAAALAVAVAGQASAAPLPVPTKVHGNTKFQPGTSMVRYGEARSAVMDTLNRWIAASGSSGAQYRKVRVEDVQLGKNGWHAVLRQKGTGQVTKWMGGQIDLAAPTGDQVRARAQQIYEGRKSATAATDWAQAKAQLEGRGLKPSQDQVSRLAYKIYQGRNAKGDWRAAERELRRSSDRVRITWEDQPSAR